MPSIVWKIFGGFGLLAALIVGFVYVWRRPELVNPTARAYRNRAIALSGEVKRWQDRAGQWRTDSLGLVADIADRDSVITKLSGEAQAAQRYGEQYKQLWQGQVAASDANTDALTDAQAELNYLKGLQANGTLAVVPGSTVTLTPQMPTVVRAGLKTLNRAELSERSLDTLSRSVGRIVNANRQLSRGLSLVAADAKQKAKGGLWPFNRRRKREEKAIAAKADSALRAVPKVVREVSDLEEYENHN